MLTEKIDRLHSFAQALLEYETLTGEEIAAVMRGEPMPTPKRWGDDTPSSSAPTNHGGGRRTSVPTTRPSDGPGGVEPSPGPA
jgi:cell division protease FtsH